MSNNSEKHIAKSTILSREGWTETAIKIFLGDADKEVKNPNYSKASPMKLFLEQRVLDVEKTKGFIEWVEKNQKRRDGAKKSIETKKNNLFEYINNLTIDVPEIEKEDLLELACDSFNRNLEWKKEKYDDWYYRKGYEDNNYIEQFENATPNSEPEFLNRITVNYLRHNLTHYEKELKKLYGKVAKDEAYYLLKEKINNSIANKYSWLAEEVKKQNE